MLSWQAWRVPLTASFVLMIAACQTNTRIEGPLPETVGPLIPQAEMGTTYSEAEIRLRLKKLHDVPATVKPINGMLTMGNAPLAKTPMISEWRFSETKNGQEKVVLLQMTSLLSKENTSPGSVLHVRTSQFDIARSTTDRSAFVRKRVHRSEAELFSIEIVVDASNGTQNVRMPNVKPHHPKGLKKLADLHKAFESVGRLIASGHAYEQGDVVRRMSLDDFFGNMVPIPKLEAEVVSRVIGRAVHRGRPILVVTTEGYIDKAGESLEVLVMSGVDMETGLVIVANAQLDIKMKKGRRVLLTTGRDVQFEGRTVMRAQDVSEGFEG